MQDAACLHEEKTSLLPASPLPTPEIQCPNISIGLPALFR